MKKILCYGDSNTFGFNPKNGARFDINTRWSGILKNNLKESFEVIEEGLNNRSGFVDDTNDLNYSAFLHLPKILEKHKDIDILIFAIGTNDSQFRFNVDYETIEKRLENIINLIKNKNIKPIIIPPVKLTKQILKGTFVNFFDEKSIVKSEKIFPIYKKIADKYDCSYFDFNDFVEPSIVDGLHYDELSHQIIAQKLSDFIKLLCI